MTFRTARVESTSPQRDALRVLLDAGLVQARELVDGDVRLVDSSRLHTVVLVEGPDGGGVALKRAPPERIEAERSVHLLAQGRPGLAAAIPSLRGCDVQAGWIARALVRPGTTLRDAHRPGRGYPPALAHAAGQVLGRWHAATTDMRDTAGDAHWALFAFERTGPAAFTWDDAASRAALDDAPEAARLAAGLRLWRDEWTPSCLMHGDLKWDNCLLDERGRVLVVDWEGACRGDPAWDMAGIIQEYLAHAELAGLDVSGPRAVRALRVAGGTELGEALAALMDAHTREVGGGPAERSAFAERATAFAGARLVQTGLEHVGHGGAGSVAVAPLLGLAAVLVERPAEVAGALGLDGVAAAV